MGDFDPAAATAVYLATWSPAQAEKAVAYTQGGHWLIAWSLLIDVAVYWLVMRSHVLVAVRARARNPWLTSLRVSALFLTISTVLTLPWLVYVEWYRERAYGLRNQTLTQWLQQTIQGAAIGIVLGTAFVVLCYALIRATRARWWLWASALSAVGTVFVLLAAPIFIEPLFNTYTPAPEGPVRAAVVELARKTGTPDDKIFIYDGARQSDRYTANVTGLFGSARVALSDAMLKKNADVHEVRAVVAHEMGHYVRQHVLWSTVLQTVLTVVGLFLLDWLYPRFERLLGAHAVGGIADPAGLPVLAVVVSLLSVLATPIRCGISRVIEADADRFALVHANEPDGMARALIKTAEYRAPSPAPIEELLFYDHPASSVGSAPRWTGRRRTRARRPRGAAATGPAQPCGEARQHGYRARADERCASATRGIGASAMPSSSAMRVPQA